MAPVSSTQLRAGLHEQPSVHHAHSLQHRHLVAAAEAGIVPGRGAPGKHFPRTVAIREQPPCHPWKGQKGRLKDLVAPVQSAKMLRAVQSFSDWPRSFVSKFSRPSLWLFRAVWHN